MATDEKKTQVLVLNPPNEITFTGPFSEVVTSHLNLQNPTNNTVIFKVKTTAPKQYCVRPNSGMLEPQKDTDIAVMLQPFDPSSVDKNKHKFMVQTMFAPPDFELEKLDEIWKKAPKTSLMDSKLRCVFVEGAPKEEQPKVPPAEDTAAEEGEAFKSILASPVQEEQTKKAEESSSATQPTAGSTPAHPGAGGNKNALEDEKNEAKIRLLQNKVDNLQAENTQLKSEANKLRQRVTTAGTAAASGQLRTKPGAPPAQSSSPLSLVAIVLILVAIILGYLVGKWL